MFDKVQKAATISSKP